MLSRIRARLTYANVIAIAALFVALGGSSYAALKLPANSVGPKQLKKNTVTSVKVKAGSLLTSDFKASQRALMLGTRGPQGARGLQGARGSQGPQGAKGDKGETGPTQGAAFAVQAGTIPSATPEFSNAARVVTTTTSGRLYVVGRARTTTDCGAGVPSTAMYVDGVPVPASAVEYDSNVATTINTFGVTESVPAGDHTVEMQTDCLFGSASFANFSDIAFSVIVLGG